MVNFLKNFIYYIVTVEIFCILLITMTYVAAFSIVAARLQYSVLHLHYRHRLSPSSCVRKLLYE